MDLGYNHLIEMDDFYSQVATENFSQTDIKQEYRRLALVRVT